MVKALIVVVGLVAPAVWAGAKPLKIGVYESEANAATYHGACQAQLREWLARNGYQVEVIGDQVAADPAQLARFAVVATSSAYIVPDAACEGLAKYVAQGGSLLWIDAPARCTNATLRAVLGIGDRGTYLSVEKAQFRMLQPSSPVLAGIGDSVGRGVGNPALGATGQALATWGEAAPGKPNFPAVVETKTGQGRAILLNLIVWHSAPETLRMLGNAFDWLLAQRQLADAACLVRLSGTPEVVTQPEAISVTAKVYGRAQLAGKSGSLRASLAGPDDKPQGKPAEATVALKPVAGDETCFAAEEFKLPTAGLADGRYTVSVTSDVEGVRAQAQAIVSLNAETLARLEREQADRCRMLRGAMGNILGDYDAEPRTPEGRVDLPRLFRQIEAAHMTMYDFLIWHAQTDWDDFRLFLPEAQKRGLKVWITLAPPSEPPPSAPFGLDFPRWAEEIGKLALQYDNLVAAVIDDFDGNLAPALFTPEYVADFAATLHRTNPRVAFLPTIYWGTIGKADIIERYGRSIDGIVFPFAELDSTQELRKQLEGCRKWLGPNRLLYINVYASGSSGTREKGPRSPEYMRSILTISQEMCDGLRIYCLPKDDFSDYRFAITAELYKQWSAGK